MRAAESSAMAIYYLGYAATHCRRQKILGFSKKYFLLPVSVGPGFNRQSTQIYDAVCWVVHCETLMKIPFQGVQM